MEFENKIEQYTQKRKEISTNLQQTLFEKYQFLNQYKEQKGILDIFNKDSDRRTAGSGDSSAPK